MKRRRKDAPFTLSYVAQATDGSLDQTLTMTNATDSSVVPTLRFRPFNAYGLELPHVTTIGVNGSHAGRAVLPAGGSLVDVLRFDGQGADLVQHVQVELAGVEQVDHPALEHPTRSVMIDLEKKATAEPDDFWGIGLVNPNPFGVTMRVSLVKLEERRPHVPQQVEDVVTLQENVDLASQSHEVIWLPEDVRGRFDQVVHHLVMPTYA